MRGDIHSVKQRTTNNGEWSAHACKAGERATQEYAY